MQGFSLVLCEWDSVYIDKSKTREEIYEWREQGSKEGSKKILSIRGRREQEGHMVDLMSMPACGRHDSFPGDCVNSGDLINRKQDYRANRRKITRPRRSRLSAGLCPLSRSIMHPDGRALRSASFPDTELSPWGMRDRAARIPSI